MNKGFTKLFNSIIASSIWSEDDKTRLMWITMLASADPAGYVSGSIPGMAAMARMSLQEAEKSIVALCTPDPYSRSKEYEGRRLTEVEGGWLILNYLKYRQPRDPETRREQNRQAQQRFREKHRVSKSKPKSANISPRQKAEDRGQKRQCARKDEKPVCDTDTGFERFWTAYPRKEGRKDAERAWAKLSPSPELVETILAAVERRKTTEQWTKENGRYIPKPATYLNGERWTDEIGGNGELTHDATEEEIAELEREGIL